MRHDEEMYQSLLDPAGSSKKPRNAKTSGRTSKGVGYGGGYSRHAEIDTTCKASSEALKREKETDGVTTHLLSEIKGCLSMVHSP